MQAHSVVINLGSLAASVSAILALLGAAIASFVKLIRKVDKAIEHNKETYLSLLRLQFISTEMPISERLIAGRKYVDHGGNGDVKIQYEALAEEYKEQLKHHKG